MNGFNKSVAHGYTTGRRDQTNRCVSVCFKEHVENTHVQTSFMALWQPVLQTTDGSQVCALEELFTQADEVKRLLSELNEHFILCKH